MAEAIRLTKVGAAGIAGCAETGLLAQNQMAALGAAAAPHTRPFNRTQRLAPNRGSTYKPPSRTRGREAAFIASLAAHPVFAFTRRWITPALG